MTEERDSTAEDMLADPTASSWFKSALHSALERDPADALNDALVLAAVLEAHLRAVFALDDAP